MMDTMAEKLSIKEPTTEVSDNCSTSSASKVDWVDTQSELDVLTLKIGANQQASVRVIETFRERLSVSDLLESLSVSTAVKNVALTSLAIDEANATKLAYALERPQSSISTLQLNNLRPEGIAALCQGLRRNSSLQELRLTFKKNISNGLLCLLLETIKDMNNLRVVYLSRLEFDAQCITELADLIRSNTSIQDLILSGCDFETSFRPVAVAIHEANAIKHLDISDNSLDDHESLILLFKTSSIRELIMSDNAFGKTCHQSQQVCDAFKYNTTLRSLDMGMNPVCLEFAKQLEQAFDYNTTLLHCWFFVPRLPNDLVARMQHIPALNKAGRGLLRQEKTEASVKQLPLLMARAAHSPGLLFGLLQEDPIFFVTRAA